MAHRGKNFNINKTWESLEVSIHAELIKVRMIPNKTLLELIELLLILASKHAYWNHINFNYRCTSIIIGDLKQVADVKAVLLELNLADIALSLVVEDAVDLMIAHQNFVSECHTSIVLVELMIG